jgi:hypothetical protein
VETYSSVDTGIPQPSWDHRQGGVVPVTGYREATANDESIVQFAMTSPRQCLGCVEVESPFQEQKKNVILGFFVKAWMSIESWNNSIALHTSWYRHRQVLGTNTMHACERRVFTHLIRRHLGIADL